MDFSIQNSVCKEREDVVCTLLEFKHVLLWPQQQLQISCTQRLRTLLQFDCPEVICLVLNDGHFSLLLTTSLH